MTADLRAAIRATPNDPALRAVYADALIQQGDPRGEWIALHRETTDAAELKRRALWQVHGTAWRTQDVGALRLGTGDHVKYVDGLLEDVSLDLDVIEKHADLLAQHPIRSLRTYSMQTLGALARLRVLETVETLALGYGVEATSAGDLVAILNATPRLRCLELGPHVDAPVVWSALERCPRVAELEGLDVSCAQIDETRARWLGTALPRLRSFRASRAITGRALRVFADTARCELDELVLNDYGRVQSLDDASLAATLQSPLVRSLTSLSLFGCDLARDATAMAIPFLECAPKLRGLNLGSLMSPSFASTLADCTFPQLVALSIRQNNVLGRDFAHVARFPTLEKLAADMNRLSGSDLGPVLTRLPKLVELSLCDNPLSSIYSIASTQFAHVLRRLRLSSCNLDGSAISTMIENGKLSDLRELDLALNNLGKPAVRKLAEGPFDKLAQLSLLETMRGEIAPLFAVGWLPAGNGYDDKYERRLELSGQAVPVEKSRAKKQPVEVPARELDDTTVYTYGEHVRHPEYGVGKVSSLGVVYFEVKFPKRGTVCFPHTPANAVPYDPKRCYAERDVIVHPQFGPGVVLAVKADRIDIVFGRNNTRTLVHARRT